MQVFVPHTNAYVCRRYDSLGNTFLNFLPAGRNPEEAEDSEAEGEEGEEVRVHTFGHFGCPPLWGLNTQEGGCVNAGKDAGRDSGKEGGRPQRPAVSAAAAAGAAAATGPWPRLQEVPSPSAESQCEVGGLCVELAGPQAPKLTLMVRNIPTWFTQDMLLSEWPNDGSYDLLYLPFSLQTRRNLGFAFINFTSAQHADAFRQRWHNRSFPHNGTKKLLQVKPADTQGRYNTLHKLTKHKGFRIKNEHFQPAIFQGSTRISLQEYLEMAQAGLAEVTDSTGTSESPK